METLLVATDFSQGSDRAFAKACEIAQGCGMKVHLLHVIVPVDEPGSSDPDTREFYKSLTELSQSKLESEESQNRRPVEVSHSVEIGERMQTIARVADEMEAAMLVLGSQPLKQESAPHLSVSHRLALISSRPVLLVP